MLNLNNESNQKLKAKIKEISSQYNISAKIDPNDKSKQLKKAVKGGELALT
jgi:hypothetical protein